MARMASAASLHIFVATDDLRTVVELGACPEATGWNLHHLSGGWWEGGIHRLWAEITLLTRADWVVGTFSSNIGRLVQILRSQAPSTFHSMDTEQERAKRPI
eukprot:1376087-Prymnesium_polylepis.1